MGLRSASQSFWDMPMDKVPGKKHITHIWGNIIYVILFIVFKICFRYRVDGIENLRKYKGKGALVVSNHTSFLDVIFFYLVSRPTQWTRFIAREQMFAHAGWIAGFFISVCGAFPISRDSADLSAVKRAVRFLKSGEIVQIFPEGTRRGKGNLIPSVHGGAALIARMAKAPIIPATVRDADKVKVKGNPLIHFKKITIEYGEPLYVSDFDYIEKSDRLDACAWYAMRECFALSYRCPAEEVDMVALFPEGRDFTQFFKEHPMIPQSREEKGALDG